MDEFLLNDLLECSVCLERLDTLSKVLPCQHTFCTKCLEEIVATKKELRCPECRVLVTVGIDELPPNVLLMRILEGMKNAGSAFPKKKSPAPQKPMPVPLSSISTVSHALPNVGVKPATAPKTACGQPMARALYDYQSLEQEDLCFKKGDLITLRCKIDTHWAQGELDGKIGIFPLTFVQVLKPLPPQVATCRALYDFRMNNDEVEGCLSFRKDELLAVIRRVDENWVEGRLNGRIGIFPLAFVELNPVAKALMKLSSNDHPGPSRVAPPTPTSEESSPLIPTDSRGAMGSGAAPEHHRLILSPAVFAPTSQPIPAPSEPAVPVTSSVPSPAPETTQISSGGFTAGRCTKSDSNSSTSTTTPNTSGTSSSSSTAPSSPASPQHPEGQRQKNPEGQQRPQQQQNAEGRQQQQHPEGQRQQQQHPEGPSLPPNPNSNMNPFIRPQTILLPTSHITTQSRDNKRHSFTAITSNSPAPITNRHSAEILSSEEPAKTTGDASGQQQQQQMANTQAPRDSSMSSPAHALMARDTAAGTSSTSQQHPHIGTQLVRQGSHRQRRSDADFAMVHLPAPYVALYPYKPLKEDELELKKGGVYLVTERCQDGWFKGTSNRTQKSGVFPGNYVTLAKPVQNSHSRVVSSSPRDPSSSSSSSPMSGKMRSSPGTRNPLLQPSPPAAQQALSSSGGESSLAPPELPPRAASPRPLRHPWNARPPDTVAVELPGGPPPAVPSKSDFAARLNTQISNTVSPPPNVSVSVAISAPVSPTSPKPADKSKEKKGSGLMKRLAAMKRSKSPTVPAYSMDNPVFEDTPSTAAAVPVLHTSHSRSGSCPSQLMQQPLPPQTHRSAATSLSARVPRQKDRPPMSAALFTQAPSRAAEGSPSGLTSLSASHRKSSSLDAADPRNSKHVVPSTKERFRCIFPYPPNSEYELELRVGDVIYVHRKRDDGWYKGTLQRTGRTGLFPASFVEAF